MKFNLESHNNSLNISAYSELGLQIAGQWHKNHLLLTPQQLFADWQAPSLATLELKDFEKILSSRPEVVLLGTGEQLQFPPAKLTADFAAKGIGLEVMNTQAACRTYNILLSENRRVAAALIQND